MRRETPTKGDMGCVWPRQESRSPTVTTKTKVGINRCLYKKNVEQMYKIQKRVPQCKMNAPREAEMALKLMKGGGPIGEFLYEICEMERGSQMGKLMVDEMEGS
jgi:hypothetical protein